MFRDMDMQVFLVLMDCDKVLKIGEELLTEDLTDLQTFPWGYKVLFVKTDHRMHAHPTGILIPKFLLLQECLVHIVYIDFVIIERSLEIYIAFFDLLVLEDISDDGSHCSVCFCWVVNDLIDCHICSLSLL